MEGEASSRDRWMHVSMARPTGDEGTVGADSTGGSGGGRCGPCGPSANGSPAPLSRQRRRWTRCTDSRASQSRALWTTVMAVAVRVQCSGHRACQPPLSVQARQLDERFSPSAPPLSPRTATAAAHSDTHSDHRLTIPSSPIHLTNCPCPSADRLFLCTACHGGSAVDVLSVLLSAARLRWLPSLLCAAEGDGGHRGEAEAQSTVAPAPAPHAAATSHGSHHLPAAPPAQHRSAPHSTPRTHRRTPDTAQRH